MKSHASKLKEKLNCARKEANDEKLAHKEDKDRVIDFQERNPKTSNPQDLHPFEYSVTDIRT